MTTLIRPLMIAAIIAALTLALIAACGDLPDDSGTIAVPAIGESAQAVTPVGGFRCGAGSEPAQSVPATTEEPSPDPYEVYLEIAPDDAPDLSREDAQTRALLGCETDFAPGTVDAALAEAYADLCDQF